MAKADLNHEWDYLPIIPDLGQGIGCNLNVILDIVAIGKEKGEIIVDIAIKEA